MPKARMLLLLIAASAVSACSSQPQMYYAVDPATGRPIAMVPVAQPAPQPQLASQDQIPQRGLFNFGSSPQPVQQVYAQPPAAAQYGQGGPYVPAPAGQRPLERDAFNERWH